MDTVELDETKELEQLVRNMTPYLCDDELKKLCFSIIDCAERSYGRIGGNGLQNESQLK